MGRPGTGVALRRDLHRQRWRYRWGASNRAGTSLTITCDVREGYDNQHCVNSTTNYKVSVRTRNGGGTSDCASLPWAPAPSRLTAPEPVTSVNVVHKGSSLEVSWDAPARATRYDVVYLNTVTGILARAATDRPGTSLTITCDSRYPGENRDCVAGGDSYTASVRARNAAGASAWAGSAGAAPPALSVADATVDEPGEGQSASLDFVVSLDRAASGTVAVTYWTLDGTATSGSDYTGVLGRLTFAAGETQKTVAVPVLPDTHDDSVSPLSFRLGNASGARIADGAATGTITNDDPVPQAWLSRFGRTVAD